MTKNTELNRDLIMVKMSKFYTKPENIEALINVVEGKSSVSLRLIDWFVTNYCKKNTVVTHSRFNIYIDYRSQLKAFSKHNFDPFKRRERIKYYYDQDKYIITTIGQLNFFKWAIENGIIEYIQRHCSEIEQDMANSYKTSSVATKTYVAASKKKRVELSKCCYKNFNHVVVPTTVSFE